MHLNNIIEKIGRKETKISVIGLGYVGLPLAVEFAEAGYNVVGIDVNPTVVDRVSSGNSHIGDVASSRLDFQIASGRLRATTSFDTLSDVDCISICVPTPLTKTKDPDITYITGAIERILPYTKPGQLLVLESTTYPGTTEELIAGPIEREMNLVVGRDIFVAFSPERVDPGNPIWTTKNTPKVIGGVTKSCSRVADALYSQVLDTTHVVGSAREAETVKLLENTFRAVNIGLVNEFMLMCNRLDIDIWRVIEAAATKPFGFMPFRPGPGIGGHCIPLDPMYMSWKARSVDFYNRFIELATDINGNMPRYVVSKLSSLLNERSKALKSSRILILGMAYKANVDDLRESPGLEVYRILRLEQHARVEYHDPHVKSFVSMLSEHIESVPLEGENLREYDAVVLITDHDDFDYESIAKKASLILDCRGAFSTRRIEGNIVNL